MTKLIHKVVTSCSDCPYFIWDGQVGLYKCWDTKIYFIGSEHQKRGDPGEYYWKQIVAPFCRLELAKELEKEFIEYGMLKEEYLFEERSDKNE